MPFRYLPDIAIADIAFEAESGTVNGLFESCGLAVSDVMVDPASLRPSTIRNVELVSDGVDTLLYDFLTELIVIKDVDSTLFRDFEVRVSEDGKTLLARLVGEQIDRERHALRNDVKAVTMHMFGVRQEENAWKATIVLDI